MTTRTKLSLFTCRVTVCHHLVPVSDTLIWHRVALPQMCQCVVLVLTPGGNNVVAEDVPPLLLNLVKYDK